MLRFKCCPHQGEQTSKRVRTSEPGKAQELEAAYTSEGRGKVWDLRDLKEKKKGGWLDIFEMIPHSFPHLSPKLPSDYVFPMLAEDWDFM